MWTTRKTLALLLVTLGSNLACSSEPEEAPDQAGTGGAAEPATGGGSGAVVGETPAGTGGEALEPSYGALGAGEVSCSAETCGAGTLCCDGGVGTGSECVASFDECECDDTWCGKYACDGPEDCPGQLCCVTTWEGYGGNIRWAGASCKDSCDPVMDAVACDTDEECPSSSFGCSSSSAGHGLNVCP